MKIFYRKIGLLERWTFLVIVSTTIALHKLMGSLLKKTQYRQASQPSSKLHYPLQSLFMPVVDLEVCAHMYHKHTHSHILTQCLTTVVGPLVIGRSSRGDIKPFFYPQTELSVKLEQGSTAIWVLKIACPHLRPFRGHSGNIMFKSATELRGHIHLHSLW